MTATTRNIFVALLLVLVFAPANAKAGGPCPANTTCVTIPTHGADPFGSVHNKKRISTSSSRQFTFCQPPKMWAAFAAYCGRNGLGPAWAVSDSRGGLSKRFDSRCGTITVYAGVHYGYHLPDAVPGYGGGRKLNWEF